MKLVRDFIPTIISESGKTCIWRLAYKDERLALLIEKLKEETTELITATTKDEVVEEIADVLEVLDAIQKEFGITKDQPIAKKNYKKLKRGGFDNFVILEGVK